jgi:hypothetical protein
MIGKSVGDQILAAHSRGKADRGQWEETWQEVAELVMPNRASFTTDWTKGTLRRRRIYDSTAEDANEVFAGGVHANLTPRQARWFFLQASDKAMRENREVKQWLYDVHNELYRIMNAPESNFHPAMHMVYSDLGALGTACLFMGERKGGMAYQCRFLGEIVAIENPAGVIDTVMRETTWKTSELIEEFGIAALPPQMRSKWERGQDDDKANHRVIHAVFPRRNRLHGMLDNTNKPFASAWVLEAEDNPVIREEGYSEFPFAVPRLSVRTGETYGVGVGIRTLPTIRMMQRMWEVYIRAAQKAIDPPLQVPDDSFLGPVRTMPGGINYYRSGDEGRIQPIETGARPDISDNVLEAERMIIRKAFYNDVFDITADSTGVNVKATFTMERRQDKLMRIAPIFSRLEPELLEPIVMRLFASALRRGLLPEPPAALEGQRIEIGYQSAISRAQRGGEVDDIMRFTQTLAPFVEGDPTVLENINTDELAQLLGHELMNVPPIIMRSPDEVAERREARAQAQAQQEGIAAGQGVAAGLKDAAQARSVLEG